MPVSTLTIVRPHSDNLRKKKTCHECSQTPCTGSHNLVTIRSVIFMDSTQD